jgi:hypothetical protein
MPQLLERIAKTGGVEKERWQTYAARFLRSYHEDSPEARDLAYGFRKDANHDLLSSVAQFLLSTDQGLKDDRTIEMAKAALRINDPNLDLLSFLGFRRLDAVPEQIELLVHPRQDIRDLARLKLRQTFEYGGAPAIADPLLAILNDPKRADDHVAAIRALSTLANAKEPEKLRDDKKRVIDRLHQILNDADNVLVIPAWAALLRLEHLHPQNALSQWVASGAITAKRADALKKIDEEKIVNELNVQQ